MVKRGKSKQVAVIVEKVKLPRSINKPKASSKKARRGRLGSLLGEVEHPLMSSFLNGLTAPDLVGPIRIPREGASQRTILGYDQTYFALGSTTNYTAYLAGRTFAGTASGGLSYGAINATTAFGPGANIPTGIQFPSPATVQDCNITAMCIVVSYIGSPLNCSGEVILGTSPDVNLDAGTFQSLSFYPGFLRIPLSTLITEGPMRVYARKISPVANEFRTTGLEFPDMEIPTVVVTPTVTAGAVSVVCTRGFECRPIIGSGNQIPYEKTTSSFTTDLNIYNDSLAVIGERPMAITEGYGEYARELAMGVVGSVLPKITNAAMRTASFGLSLGAAHMRRLGMGPARGPRSIGGGGSRYDL